MQKALSPRKMPRQARAVATRDAILEAAAQLLGSSGLSALTTNSVAERAGVSIGSLYQYFPNKDALMVALIARQQAQQSAQVIAAARALHGATMESAIVVLVRAAMQHHHENPILAKAIDHEEARLPVGALVAAELAKSSAALAALLHSITPGLSADAAVKAVRTLPAVVRAVVDAWANLDPPQPEIAEAEAVSVVCGYLDTIASAKQADG
jgi:AcrR family transcriptional regulator